MQPQEIFEQVTAAYSRLDSYQDKGVVFLHLRGIDQPSEMLFQTWFARPLSFRFDWRDQHPFPPLRHLVTNHSVRAAGGPATSWQDDPPQEETNTLQLAIAGATGVTYGAAYDVPHLLIPDVVDGWGLDGLSELSHEDTQLFEGTMCHVVSGHDRHTGATRFWIGAADWLLRKAWNAGAMGMTSEQIRRDIVVNAIIQPRVFTTGGSLLGAG